MPSTKKSSKRPATAAPKQADVKRPRADVHQLQVTLAERAFRALFSVAVLGTAVAATAATTAAATAATAAVGPAVVAFAPLIIAATMGTGKPRIAGKCLDELLPKLVEVPVLAITVVTDAKHGREQAAQWGTDLPGPYHDSDFSRVMNLLKGDGHAARIMIPFVTFRKMCYTPKGGTSPMWDLLDKLGQPDVVFMIDEVTEVYKPANGRLPAAIDALRFKYAKATCATIRVVGMSGTPELENEAYAARAKTLFGADPTLVSFTKEEEEKLLNDINPQLKVSTRDHGTVEKLPDPTESVESLKDLSTLVVGNALSTELSLGDTAVKKRAGEMLVDQVLGDDQDGGILFQKFAAGRKAPMLKVKKDGKIGDKVVQAYETVLIAADSSYSTKAVYAALTQLKKRSGTEGLSAFTVHDMRLEAQKEAANWAEKIEHEYLPRDVADLKAALKAALADAKAQTGTVIIVIDKRQALSGTNDFAIGVQRAIAIGAWTKAELDQFYKRLCRACTLEPGDLVAKVFYGVHIASPFWANLIAKASQRDIVTKEQLSEEAKTELATLEAAAGTVEGKEKYRKAEDTATMLAATKLPDVDGDDPALTYLKCITAADAMAAFKTYEYLPLIEHHEDCEREEEKDQKTGKTKMKVTKCAPMECKCIFHKDGLEEDE